jgi:hypothetical protein
VSDEPVYRLNPSVPFIERPPCAFCKPVQSKGENEMAIVTCPVCGVMQQVDKSAFSPQQWARIPTWNEGGGE